MARQDGVLPRTVGDVVPRTPPQRLRPRKVVVKFLAVTAVIRACAPARAVATPRSECDNACDGATFHPNPWITSQLCAAGRWARPSRLRRAPSVSRTGP